MGYKLQGGEPTCPTRETGLQCADCGSRMRRRWSERRRKWFYGCVRWPQCNGVLGCHPDGSPLGKPADSATRMARSRLHELFDGLWHGPARRMRRKDAYALLARLLGMRGEDCHIALFDADRCRESVKVLEVWLRSNPAGSGPGRLVCLDDGGDTDDWPDRRD